MNTKLTIILTVFVIFTGTLRAQNHADTNLIVKTNWGLCFTKCSNWSITSNTNKNITLIQTTGQWSGDIMTIEYVSGDTIKDDSGKFGWILYWHDEANKSWMKQFSDEEGLVPYITKPADTLGVLADGFPIFRGNGVWATLIIPLSNKTFLKCNVTGSGATDPVFLLAGTIRKIK